MSTVVEIRDDNESIELRVTTTTGECGLNPCTDNTADPAEPVQIRVRVYVGSNDHARVDYSVYGFGKTIAEALAGKTAHWIECVDLRNETRIQSALGRVVPQWEIGEIDAKIQIQSEHEASKADDATWMAELNTRESYVDWYAIPSVVVP